MRTMFADSPGSLFSAGVVAESRPCRFALSSHLARYVLEKGWVALDGVSLTVTSVANTSFDLALIPHTLEVATFGQRSIGDSVNIAADTMGKCAERWVQTVGLDAFRPTDSGSMPTPATEA